MLDENLYLHWYIVLKDQQAAIRGVKSWDIKRGDHGRVR